MDQNKEVMTPTEFVLWLNGATSMVDGPPSAEQWANMQEKLFPIIAKMMTDKLLDKADDAVKLQELKRKMEQEQLIRNQQLLQHLRNQKQMTYTTATSIAPMHLQGTLSMDELIANRTGYSATTVW